MNPLSKIFCAAASLAALAGCATGYHYSQIDGYRYYKAPIDTHPLIITKVDGASTLPGTRPVPVEPGPRVVAVQTYPSKLDPLGEEKSINLDVKPGASTTCRTSRCARCAAGASGPSSRTR